MNQVQPQFNNNRRRAGAEPPRFRDEDRPWFGENRRDMRYPYQGRDKQRDDEYPYHGQEYRRGDRYPYDNYRREATYPYRSQYYPREEAYPFVGGPRGPINHGRLEYPRDVMDNNGQKAAPRIGYTGLPRREGNADECYYCHQPGHRKPECSLFRKHQDEANDYAKKPMVAANVVTPNVCVMTRAQRAAKENSKEESESEDEEDDRKSEDSENSDSDDERDTIKVMDEESEELSENENEPKNRRKEHESQVLRDAPEDSEWKKKREIHRQVTNEIKEIQREAGEDLLEPEDLAPKYRKSAKGKAMKEEPRTRVGQIIRKVLDSTQANITIGQLLEIAPYCKRRVMEAIYTKGRDEGEVPQTYLVAAKDFDEEMPMIAVWTKNRRIPNVLLDGGSGVNIITDTLMEKLGIGKQLEVAPFTIKMADQRKVMPLGIIKNLKITIGGLTFKITVTVMKMENQENCYSMLLGRPWLKQARAKHDWGKSQLVLYQKGIDVCIGTNRRPKLPDSSRPINIEGFDWELGLTDEEEEVVYQAYPSLHHIADVELDGLKQLYETECNMVMTNVEGENVENTTKRSKAIVKKKEKLVPNLKEGTPKQKEDMGEKPIYPSHFYETKEGEQAIDQTPASEAVKGKTIAGWTVEDEDMIKEINLGTTE